MRLILATNQPAQTPFAQKTVEGDVHVAEQHVAFSCQQVNIVDHFDAPAVHVENGPSHEVLVDEKPAFLIDKGRIGAAFGRRDEDGIILDALHLVPGN